MAAGGGQVAPGSLTRIRRLSLAPLLLVVAVAPGPAARSRSGACTGPGGPGGAGRRAGRRVGACPGAPFGGAVAADAAATVIVGPHAVTRYANRTGAVLWTRPAGQAGQAWQEDGNFLDVAVAAGGYLGAAPVTALRRI